MLRLAINGYGRIGHPGALPQRGFDFAEFDAVSAQLDLTVDATQEFDYAVQLDPTNNEAYQNRRVAQNAYQKNL